MANVEALTIGPGCEVTMHFQLTLEDGTVAVSTLEAEPITFVMGDGSLIEGLELALYGLKVGDKQVLSIEPREAFGFPDEENFHEMPVSEFPKEMNIEEGMIIEFDTPSGERIPGTLTEIKDDMVTVDFNHPLAGHVITFDVEIVDIKSAA